MARSEMEKCAVVRMLAKQKGHLQQLLDRQERELDMIKQTKVRIRIYDPRGISASVPDIAVWQVLLNFLDWGSIC